jgi:hypothetical protein
LALERLVVEGVGVGAGEAETLAIAVNEAIKVDAFAAKGASDAGALVAGELAGGQRNADPGFAEEVGVGELAIGRHLLCVLFEGGIEICSERFGCLKGDQAEAFVVVLFKPGVEVYKRRGHFAEVAEFESALAHPGCGNDADGVGGAAVDFYEDDEAFAVGVEAAVGEGAEAGVLDSQPMQRQHGHADAEDLAGTEMAVSEFGFVEQGIEGSRHGDSMLRESCGGSRPL